MATLTPAQKRVMDFLRNFITRRGYAPTLEEIASGVGVTKATAQTYVRILVGKKVLRRQRYAHRSIELVEAAASQPRCLPLLGRIAAGKPIEAVENPEWVDLAETLDLLPGKSFYLLQVSGDSMIDDGIFDGDYAVVEERQSADNGDTVVAVLGDGTATLKRFYREPRRVRLDPRNPKLKPIYARDVSIRGVVRGVVRSLR
jgi:repressor LexA